MENMCRISKLGHSQLKCTLTNIEYNYTKFDLFKSVVWAREVNVNVINDSIIIFKMCTWRKHKDSNLKH